MVYPIRSQPVLQGGEVTFMLRGHRLLVITTDIIMDIMLLPLLLPIIIIIPTIILTEDPFPW